MVWTKLGRGQREGENMFLVKKKNIFSQQNESILPS